MPLNPSSNGVVEANVNDVKLTVLDILGQVSLGFDFAWVSAGSCWYHRRALLFLFQMTWTLIFRGLFT